MASWFGKDRETEAARTLLAAVPAHLKDKTPEELKAYLEKAEKDSTRLAELEAKDKERDTAVQNLNNNFNAVKAKLDSIEANGGRKDQTPPNNEEPADFVLDPDKAFADRARPLTNLTVQTAQLTARMQATQNLDNRDVMSNGKYHDGRLFRFWEAEIMERAKGYQAVVLTQPQSWIDIYLIVKGLHSDELADPEQRKKNYSFMESASSPASGSREPEKKDDQLTEIELNIAKKMNVKPEDYLKRKKAMTFVGA